MNSFLRQSTASQSRAVGPFLDSTDFITPETALTINNTDILLITNGGASAAKNAGGGTHRANGVYGVTFDATDTATVGEIFVTINVTGALPVFHTFVVVPAAVFDAFYETGALGYNAAQIAASVTGAVGSVTGAVGSVTGNVGGNVVGNVNGSVGSVVGAVGSVTAAVTVGTINAGVITAAAIADGAFTAAKFAAGAFDAVWSVTARTLTSFGTLAADTATAVWAAVTRTLTGTQTFDLTGNITGNLSGSVGSVTGNVGGNVVGSVASVTGDIGGLAAGAVTDVQDAVWDAALASHADPGSTGEALAAAGAAGDPWATVLPGAYGAGTAGQIVGTNLDLAVSTRLAPTTAGRTLDVTAGGTAGIDWANVEAPTAVNGLTGTTIATSQVVASVTGAVGSVTGNVGGNVNGNVVGSVGSVVAAVTVGTINAGVITATVIADGALTAAKFAAGAFDAVWTVASRTLTSFGTLAADVWAVATRQLTGTQAFNLTGNITGNLSGSVGSVTGNVGGDVQGNVGGSVASVIGNVGGNVTGNVTGSVGSLAAQAQTDVNTQVLDVLNVDTFGEPTGVPPATTTLVQKIGRVYMALRNGLTVTATDKTFLDDAGNAEWKKALSDDGTTYTESEGGAP